MLRHALSIAFCTLFALGSNLPAQQPELPGPEKEHQFLSKFVGEWESKSEARLGPDQPPMQCTGSASARMLGEFWLISEVKGDWAGEATSAVQTIGYDASKKKYVGTWVDSMINHMWKYEGTVDEAGTTLTLEAEGPNFMAGGKSTKFRDAYQFKSADHIVATSSMLGEDGKWVTFMTGEMKRKKK